MFHGGTHSYCTPAAAASVVIGQFQQFETKTWQKYQTFVNCFVSIFNWEVDNFSISKLLKLVYLSYLDLLIFLVAVQ